MRGKDTVTHQTHGQMIAVTNGKTVNSTDTIPAGTIGQTPEILIMTGNIKIGLNNPDESPNGTQTNMIDPTTETADDNMDTTDLYLDDFSPTIVHINKTDPPYQVVFLRTRY